MTEVRYTLSEQGRKNRFIETGKRQFGNQYTIQFDDTALTPAQRRIFADAPVIGIGGLRLCAIALTAAKIPEEINLGRDGEIQSRASDKPKFEGRSLEFDSEPDLETALSTLNDMAKSKAFLMPDFCSEMGRYEDYKSIEKAASEKARAAYQAEQALLKAENERKAGEARKALLNIEWKDDDTAIHNLHNAVFAISGLEVDSRFKSWIKRISAVDVSKDNGYCFDGSWLNDQTVIVKREAAVFLVASTTGSRKYNSTNYVVVIMDSEGNLTKTAIATDDSDKGWALRIREQVAALL